MNQETQSYHVIAFPVERRLMRVALDLPRPKHSMYALLEVDVTLARQFIAEHKARSGETLSFTGFLLFCLARAVDEDKSVQAYLKGARQLVMFDDVDVGLMVEHTVGDKHSAAGYVVRCANRKTYLQIHQEIRAAQAQPPASSAQMPAWLRFLMLLPWPLSGLFTAGVGAAARRDPTIATSVTGTVGISTVGMFGRGHGGWGLFPASHSLDVVVGSTASKPAVVAGRIEPREMLCLTLVFDHGIVDGAPAARFTRRFVELVESACGLVESGQAARFQPALASF